MTTNKAYFRVRGHSLIDDGYLTKLAKWARRRREAIGKWPGVPPASPTAHSELAVVEWHGLFDEAPIRALGHDRLVVMRRIGRPDDLTIALHIEVNVNWDLPHTGVPMSPSTLRLLADLDVTLDIDIVPNLSPQQPET